MSKTDISPGAASATDPAPVGSAAAYAIEVAHLVKVYKATRAVDDVSFSIPRGSVTGLLGGNGAGKTTTIGMIMGLIEPTDGAIKVFGHDMALARYDALGRMNFESPYVDLPHRLTVRQNLRIFGLLYDVADLEAKIETLADELALRDFLDRFGFRYEFASSTEYYTSGRFDAALLRVLERFDAVMNIMLPSLREENSTLPCGSSTA